MADDARRAFPRTGSSTGSSAGISADSEEPALCPRRTYAGRHRSTPDRSPSPLTLLYARQAPRSNWRRGTEVTALSLVPPRPFASVPGHTRGGSGARLVHLLRHRLYSSGAVADLLYLDSTA